MGVTCLSCEIVSGRRGVTGGPLCETERFHAHQDVAYPVPGLVIVASKRHFKSFIEMDDGETQEFLPLIQKIRRAQSRVGIDAVYYFYNEDTKHHFNFWMVPRYPWMASFGKSVEAVRPALIHARDQMASEEEISFVAQTAARLRLILTNG
ncbi:MAG: diadenosine tetraphosphate hydrolase [Hyphomicrobiales bacterium]|nr:MAG: diadenosine tetraphosphate hydrolase [Hyphomicrobiales bacterium]